ncbi:MAG: type II toxin-antitoxin system RelE/ParE family toxin [Deltaproteobacteria bacterium]|jgi:mRNA interferase RelE/StbE|nr:type II toxin-antitoxin system RelE/ParE family toxin [Deltaproteobacteria bacterium]
MNYKLRFHRLALKEWRNLDSSLRDQFKKKLAERLAQPRAPSAALSKMPDCYKIKLHKAGYRLVYLVEDELAFVTVISIGKRDRMKAYKTGQDRI